MLDAQPSLAFPFRLTNKMAKYLGASKLTAARLDEETLCREAISKTGLTDFGDPYYREGLLVLLESAEKDANLHFVGRTCLHGMIVTFLANRLLLTEARKQSPELFKGVLLPPIIVLGLPRTGTTYLHRMLAIDSAHRAVPFWELLRPLPNGSQDRRREYAEAWVKFSLKLNPKRDRVHYTRADTPEECITLQGTTFTSIAFAAFAPVFGYAEWYGTQDHLQAYQEYYRLLQVLQAVDPERRLVLKAPAHTGSLPSLFKLIPDALIIQTHRHPVTACNSASSNCYSAYTAVSEKIDVPRLAKVTIDLLEKWATTSLQFRATNPGIIYDVYYNELVADPMGTVKGIYDHFDLRWSGVFQKQLQAYVRGNQRGKYGQHRYSSADFGLTDEAIAGHFVEYSEKFGFVD